MDTKALARQVVATIRSLPPMPDSIDRLLRLSCADEPERDEVLSLIESDPGLCTTVMSMAGTICYGQGRGASNPAEALELVGPRALAELTGVSYATWTLEDSCARNLCMEEHLDHALEISRGCRALAEVCGENRTGQADYSVAGLIHDIGRVVIAGTANASCARLMGTSPQALFKICGEERELLGMDHCDVGAELCGKWGFQSLLAEGVQRHHSPLIGDDDLSRPGAIIFLAHLVTMSDLTGAILQQLVPDRLCSGLGIEVAELQEARRLATA